MHRAWTFETIRYEVDGPVCDDHARTGPTRPTRRTRQLIDELDAAFDAGRRRRRRAGRRARRRGQALLGRPRPQGARWPASRRSGRAMRDTPEGKLRHEQVMYFDKLRAAPRLPQADDRRGAGRVLGRRADAGVHVRPHRRRRRRPVLQPGAAHDGRRRRAAGRAVGARAPQGQGVPALRRDARRRARPSASGS